ncbi:MAG TPA: Asp-tRNA(Asn)/Glu-tRNA(Gln) amidotransferase GatCAB subunit A [Gammaproteobacteria bacterium]|jgi:aspartyl-tRNA(Asn)/glutamyl-tRNA(Gln) amidotransferase subunit A|nr:MAG: Asp-tRNA(Asn)/Glu-tRNA(Gln) amidotransferase GatCAB subunit A [Candidatus Thioglobus sp. MED-G23]HCL93323.1 Asp-tRNA(Asn)/Glu-tRNA(Gln) amidotransferase GatCAB subunit A [Gammaproteobacteria bacterium]|tara:strand:- start:689 stop:2143 length:1455 start_codon:yes stop_codon:yes gene_type:complete
MLHEHTLTALRDMLRRREISSTELTQHCLDRIAKHSDLNAFVTLDESGAMAAAAVADKQLASGEADLLTGVPIAHKDIFCTRGVLTTCGSKMLENFVSPYDATVVERFHQAGSVTIGKTNMDEFAMGSSNETSFFGSVKNPWDPDRVPGGSSGGSAAAVAACLVAGATGTDTGGSIRQPAAFCGLTGLKPSYGRVSRYGMIAFASSLDQGGPITRNAEDAALMLQCMAGFDPRDSTSINAPAPDMATLLGAQVRGLKLGLPKEFFDTSVDAEVLEKVRESLAVLERLGATLVDVSLPNSPAGIPCYYVIAPAEASSNLSRFDGVRFGHRSEHAEELVDLYENSRAEGFGEEVKRRILIGTYALSAGYYDAYYLKAQKIRRVIAQDFETAFEQCDVIVGPTSPTTAFPLGAKTQNPVAMYLNDIFTNTVNLAGLPGLSVPCGFDTAGLPVGLQLIGKFMDEASLLSTAHQLQQETDWHQRMPAEY